MSRLCKGRQEWGPITTNALPIDPYHSLRHPCHGDSNRVLPFGFIKVCLPKKSKWSQYSPTQIFESLLFKIFFFFLPCKTRVLASFFTLYHVTGVFNPAPFPPELTSSHFSLLDPSSVYSRFFSPFTPTCKWTLKYHFSFFLFFNTESEVCMYMNIVYLMSPVVQGDVKGTGVQTLDCNGFGSSIPPLHVSSAIL